MPRIRSAFLYALAGLFVGAAALFIAVVATGAVALVSSSSARIPGVFAASALSENGAAALSFTPNFSGMAVVLLVCGVIFVPLGLRRRDNARSR